MNRRRRRSSANTKPRRESPSTSIIDEISSVSPMATSAKSSSSSSSSSSLSLDMPWKTRVAISVLSRVTDYCRRPDGTVNRRLLGFLDLKSPPNPTPVNGVSSSNVPVDPSRDLWFRLYTPTAAADSSGASLPVLVFFHGGGFSFLSPASKAYDAVCRRFARKLPAVVVSVNYRLTPEHRFPSQYDDCFDVLRFLDESSALPPIADASKCFLAGDSAGGNIAHHMAVRACQSEKKLERVRVVGLVAIQPFFGGTERTESETRLEEAPLVSVRRTDWCWTAFLPEGEDRDHWAVNVSGPNAVDVAGLEGFPATLVFSAGFDPLRDWQKRYYEWLRRSGKEAELVDYPRMFHAFYIFPEVAQATELIMKVKDFIHNTIISLPNGE